MTDPLPLDEPARLDALRRLDVLDTPPEPAFDDLTRLAAAVCGTPMALVSLMDCDRQWFKSRVGVDVTETPRGVSICDHAIRHGKLFVVPDASADPRFRDNPFVTGEAHVRFYAGMPLTTPEGHAVGTLCVIDRTPRELTPVQRDALEVLGRQVVAQLRLRYQVELQEAELAERRRVEAELRASEERFRAFMSAGPAVAFMKDDGGRYTYVNEPVVRRFGMPADHWLGRTDEELFPAAYSATWRENDRAVLAGGRAVEFRESVPEAGGGVSHWTTYKFPVRDAAGQTFLAGIGLDVTAQKAAEEAVRASEAKFRALVEQAADAVFLTGPEGTVVDANPRACEALGYAREELLGTPVRTFDPFLPADEYARILAELAAGRAVCFESRHRRRDGTDFPVEVRMGRVDLNGRPHRLSIARDITARRAAEGAVRASEAKFRGTIDRLAEGVFLVDAGTRRFVEVNAAVLAMLGYTQAEFLALTPFDIVAGEDEAAYARTVRAMDERLAREGRCDLGPRRLRRKDGTTVPVEIKVSVVPDGGAGLHAVIVRDTTAQTEYEDRLLGYQLELERANARLKTAAVTDGLTGVNNRAAFNERLADEYERAVRHGRPLSVVLMDVDHFKAFNDTFGHPAGDEVLRGVAGALAATARGTDVVARYGGEEFAVILPETDFAGAMVLAERCRRAIAGTPWELRAVTVSVGVATLTPTTAAAHVLVREADEALYRAKQAGRNRVNHGGGNPGSGAIPMLALTRG